MDEVEDERWHALTAQGEAYLHADNATALDAVGCDLVALDPHHPRGYRYRAEAACTRSAYRKAIALQREALARDPQNAFLIFRLAVFLRLAKMYRKAETEIRQAIELDPNDAENWLELAEICYWMEDVPAMETALAHTLVLEPAHPDAAHLTARAAQAFSTRPSAQTVVQYEDALERDPENSYVHGNLGREYARLREWDKAEAHLREALRLAPDDKEFRPNFYEVLKKRSTLYRIISWPVEIVTAFSSRLVGSVPIWVWLVIIPLIAVVEPLWDFIEPPVYLWILIQLVTLFFWLPLVKAYHYFVIGDIRRSAREVGVGSGMLGFHGWPLSVRMGIFVLTAVSFWALLLLFLFSEVGEEVVLWSLLALGVFGFGYLLVGTAQWITRRRARKRRRAELKELGSR